MPRSKVYARVKAALSFVLVFGVFTLSLAVGAVLHLGMPVARTATAKILQTYLNGLLKGTIEIGSIARLAGGNATVHDVQVFDPQGRLVISVKRLDASIDLVGLTQRLLTPYAKLSIEIEYIGAQDVQVYLLPSQSRPVESPSALSLVDAFTPVETESTSPSGEGRPLRIWMPKIILHNASADGAIFGSPVLHTDVERAKAKLLITDKGVLLDIDRFGLRSSGLFGVDTSARGEIHVRVPGAVFGNVSGALGEIPLACEFRVEGKQLDVKGNLPRLQPAQIRPILGNWPLDATIAANLNAHGSMPDVQVSGDVSLLGNDATETSVLTAQGSAHITKDLALKLSVATQDLDLSKLMYSLPQSQLSSETDLRLDIHAGTIALGGKTQLHSGSLAGVTLPPARIESSYQDQQFKAETWIEEPQLVLHASIHQTPHKPLQLSVDLRDVSTRSPYLAPYVKGLQGTLAGGVQAQYEPDAHLNGQADLRAKNLSYGGWSAATAGLTTQLSGNPSDVRQLVASTQLNLHDLKNQTLGVKSLTINQRGSLLKPHLQLSALTTDDLELAAEANADVADRSISEVKATLSGRGEPLSLTAKQLGLKNDRIIAKDFVLKSMGEVRGDIDFGRHGGTIKATATRLNVARISQHLGLAPGELEGELSGNFDLDIGPTSHGTVEISVRKAAYKGLINSSVALSSRVEGNHITAKGNATVPGLGKLVSQLDWQVQGSLLNLHHLRSGRGSIKSEIKNLDLKTLSLLTGLSNTLSIDGTARLKFDLARTTNAFPDLELSLNTDGLSATIPTQDGPALSLDGVDINGVAKASVEGSRLETALHLKSRDGPLVSISGSQSVPLRAWWNEPPAERDLLRALWVAPLDMVVLVPERKISQFPFTDQLPLRSGRFAARIAVTGSLSRPSLGVLLEARDLLTTANSPTVSLTRAVSTRVSGRYSAETGSFVANATLEDDDRPLGSLTAELNLPWQHLTHPPQPTVPLWTGRAQLQLEDFPLEAMESAASRGVRGDVGGTVSIARTGILPDLDAELSLRRVSAGGYHIGDARLTMFNRGSKVTARAELEDDFGDLSAQAQLAIAQLDGGFALDPSSPVRLELRANKYNVAAARPFLQGVFDEISGPVSGQMAVELTPPQGEHSARARLSGALKLKGGTLRPSALGVRLRDVQLSVNARPEGELNVVYINDIQGKAQQNSPQLTGHAVVRLRGFSPENGEFELNAQQLPIAQGSTPLATITSKVKGTLELKDKALLVSVGVRQLLAQLAEGVDDELIDTTDNPDIEIVQLPKQEIKKETTPSLPVLVQLDLGDDVRIKNSLLDVRLGGSPSINLTDGVAITGGIELRRGGKFVVLGRNFLIDRGLIVFDTGETSDPHLQIGATWAAPNNVTVRLDVGGTLSAPTLNWSSDPALPGGEADILALVIGGGSGFKGGGSIAIVANELSTIEGLEFYSTQQTGAGNSRVASLNDDTWDSYTASYQINDKLWFEGSYERQTSSATSQVHGGVSGTLDWRFLPQWALRTEVGTLGMGLDLLWQYRY